MLYGSIRRNLYAHLSIHKMRWTLVFDYLFTPISTPKWHETIWFCMKFYKLAISKNLVTMRFYGLLLRYIDLWKKANLQRYLISFYLLPVRKPLIYRGFRLSEYSLSANRFFASGNVSKYFSLPFRFLPIYRTTFLSKKESNATIYFSIRTLLFQSQQKFFVAVFFIWKYLHQFPVYPTYSCNLS